MPYNKTISYAQAASQIIGTLSELLLLITLNSKTARCKRRDFEEQMEELRDTAAEIDSILEELRQLQADNTITDEVKTKKKSPLHNRLATEIRRYVHLYQFKMKNTWEKLQEIQAREDHVADLSCKHPVPEMPPMEKMTIHTDVGSGISTVLLKDLLTEPVGRFAVFCRWFQNRCHFWTCCGTTLPPAIRMKCLRAIDFDNNPPNTSGADSCPLVVPPITPITTTFYNHNVHSVIDSFGAISMMTGDDPTLNFSPSIHHTSEHPTTIVPFDNSDKSGNKTTNDVPSEVIPPVFSSPIINRQEPSIRLVPYDYTDESNDDD